METVVAHLDDRGRYEQYLQYLGGVHEKLGTVEKSSLDVMGPIFCQAIRPVLQASSHWNQDVRDSWLHLFRIVAYWMKQGYNTKVRTHVGCKHEDERQLRDDLVPIPNFPAEQDQFDDELLP